MAWFIIAAVFLAGGVLGVFVMLVLGIHAEERRKSLKSGPQTAASSSTRQVLARVRRPGNDVTKFSR